MKKMSINNDFRMVVRGSTFKCMAMIPWGFCAVKREWYYYINERDPEYYYDYPILERFSAASQYTYVDDDVSVRFVRSKR